MNLDRTAVAKAVALMQAGKNADPVLSRAVRHIPGTFARLRAYKAHVDAAVKQTTASEPGEIHVCRYCGDDFPSHHAKRVHEGRWCDEKEIPVDPRAHDAVARYATEEPVMEIVADYGISTSTLYAWARRLRVEKRTERRSA